MVICDVDDVLNGIKNNRMVKRAIANRPYNTFFHHGQYRAGGILSG